MPLFNVNPKSKKPSYVLIDRLPASIGPRLLGRVVIDIENPTDNFRPKDHLHTPKNEPRCDQAKPPDAPRNEGTESSKLSENGSNSSAKESEESKTQKDPARDTPKVETVKLSTTNQNKMTKPIDALRNEQVEIEDSAFSFLFSQNNTTVQAKLGEILGVSIENGKAKEATIDSRFVRTVNLTQHYDTLKALLKDHRDDISELLPLARRRKAYMVVGLKAAVDAKMSKIFSSTQQMSLEVAFPTGQVAKVASHGTVDIDDVADAKANANVKSGTTMKTSAQMVGEQIFAIRYRVLNLKVKNKDELVSHGDILRVNHEDGVYSVEDREFVFDEDDFDDEEPDDWDEDEITLSSESIRSEIGKAGTHVFVAEFDQ